MSFDGISPILPKNEDPKNSIRHINMKINLEYEATVPEVLSINHPPVIKLQMR